MFIWVYLRHEFNFGVNKGGINSSNFLLHYVITEIVENLVIPQLVMVNRPATKESTLLAIVL